LIPVTGRLIDPVTHRRFTETEERNLILNRLARLPPRHAVMCDKEIDRAFEIRAENIDFNLYHRRSEQAGPELREAYLRGSHGVPVEELLAEATPTLDRSDSQDVAPQPGNNRSPRRPSLKVPQ
jgi:hypothetical protein